MARLDGKTAIVTGGASGIGAAIVRRFASEGATVIVADIDQQKGIAIAQEVKASFASHDVSNPDSWAALLEGVRARGASLDILINNAGIIANRTIETLDLETWSRTLNVNLTGTMLGCKFGIEAMKRGGTATGSIVNLASTAGYLGTASDVAYSASKGGVRLLTKSIASYCASQGLDIRCNAILPGTIETEIIQPLREVNPAVVDTLQKMSPMHRFGQPQEIASMALFLASDESSYCTGGDFMVDGGLANSHPDL